MFTSLLAVASFVGCGIGALAASGAVVGPVLELAVSTLSAILLCSVLTFADASASGITDTALCCCGGTIEEFACDGVE